MARQAADARAERTAHRTQGKAGGRTTGERKAADTYSWNNFKRGRCNEMRKYFTLNEVLKLLPGVKPNIAKEYIMQSLVEFRFTITKTTKKLRILNPSKRIGERKYNDREIDEICHEEENYFGNITICTSPVGAKLVLEMYHNGYLPMKSKAGVAVPDQKLIDYIAREESYKQDEKVHKVEVRKAIQQQKKAQERINMLIEHPETLKESDFTYALLNDIFFHHLGKGSGAMTIGGVDVSKSLDRYTSNSRKSSDCEVTFSWIGKDGERHTITKESKYKGNRISDESRNWGLGKNE